MNHLRAPIEWRCSRGPRGLPTSILLANTPWIVVTRESNATVRCCFWSVNGFFTYYFPYYAFQVSSSSSNAVCYSLRFVSISIFKCLTAASIRDLSANFRTKQTIKPHSWYEDIQSCLALFDQRPNSIPQTEKHHLLMNYSCLDNAGASYIARCAAKVWSSGLAAAIFQSLRTERAN